MHLKKVLLQGIVSMFLITNIFYHGFHCYADEKNHGEANVVESDCVVCDRNSESVETSADVEEILLEIGTPLEVVETYTEEEKEFIWENLKNKEAEYLDYELQDAQVVGSGMLRTTSTTTALKNNVKFTVSAYSVRIDGEKCVALFPRFKWSTNDEVKNDCFAFNLPDGWEITATPTSLKLYAYNVNDTLVRMVNYTGPCDMSFQGVAYLIEDGGVALPGGHYEGMMAAYARKKDSSASNQICIRYVHDYSSKSKVTYGISWGLASISIPSNSKESVALSGMLNFSYK